MILRRRLRYLASIVWGLLLLWVSGCVERSHPLPEPPRLVLLYVPCTVSKLYLSPYRPGVSYTPELERFAREGVVFERHQTEAGLSGIAYASIISGAQVFVHGVTTHPRPLDGSVHTVAERFAEAGYETFFWDRHMMASSRLHYDQGVEPSHVFHLTLRPGDRRFTEIVSRLKADPGYRVFIMAFFSVSHAPYPPQDLEGFCADYPDDCQPFEGESEERTALYLRLHETRHTRFAYDFPRFIRGLDFSEVEVEEYAQVVERLYKSRIRELDTMFGGVVEELRRADLLDASLVAFTADHGEVLYRKDVPFKWTHGHALTPEDLGVPWIVRAGRLPAGRYPGVTRSIDVAPTLAALAGLAPAAPGPYEGRDLSRAMQGLDPPPPLVAYSHTAPLRDWGDLRRVPSLLREFYPRDDPALIWVSQRRGDQVFKYRNLGNGEFSFQAFDLASDPTEQRDLLDSDDPLHREAMRELSAYKTELIETWAAHASGAQVPGEEANEMLRALGYAE